LDTLEVVILKTTAQDVGQCEKKSERRILVSRPSASGSDLDMRTGCEKNVKSKQPIKSVEKDKKREEIENDEGISEDSEFNDEWQRHD
jgi:hypothetical protein